MLDPCSAGGVAVLPVLIGPLAVDDSAAGGGDVAVEVEGGGAEAVEAGGGGVLAPEQIASCKPVHACTCWSIEAHTVHAWHTPLFSQ